MNSSENIVTCSDPNLALAGDRRDGARPLADLERVLAAWLPDEPVEEPALSRLWCAASSEPGKPGTVAAATAQDVDRAREARQWIAKAREASRAQDFAQAESCLLVAIALGGETADVWLQLARTCSKSKQWEKAATFAWRLIAQTGVTAKALALSSRIFRARGLPLRAALALNRALALSPADPELSAELEMLLLDAAGSDERRLGSLHDVLGEVPWLMAGQASLALSRGDTAGALAHVCRLRLADETPGSIWLLLGRIEVMLDRRGMACDYLTRAIGRSDLTPAELRLAADLLSSIGKESRAADVLLSLMADDEDVALRTTFLRTVRHRLSDSPAPARMARPVVLISQVQRSGGTLLSQLLDGHPELLAHPHEIQIGRPNKWNWPALDTTRDPAALLESLWERRLPYFVSHGYTKSDGNPLAAEDAFDFHMDLVWLARHFIADLERSPPTSQRDILDAYFSAYFSSWRSAPAADAARWITGFIPRLVCYRESVERFFRDYPDGHLVCCVRDPATWLASSQKHHSEYADARHALTLWRLGADAALTWNQLLPDQVHLLTYESLVTATASEMRHLASRLGIEFSDILLTPSFAGHPTRPNSSFTVATRGVSDHALQNRRLLDEDARALVEAEATPLYGKVVDRIRSNRSQHVS